MEISAQKRLFWFLKEGSISNLSNSSTLDMVVQQIMTHGNFSDVKLLLAQIPRQDLTGAFQRVEHFLPADVRNFWEDFFAGH